MKPIEKKTQKKTDVKCTEMGDFLNDFRPKSPFISETVKLVVTVNYSDH